MAGETLQATSLRGTSPPVHLLHLRCATVHKQLDPGQLASSEARNTAALPISSGCPIRPKDVDPKDLARYISILLNGLGVQAVNGATKSEMNTAIELALRSMPL